MRILYICRVFSGFETSLCNRSWEPTGAPTIYKIMEALDQSKNEIYFLMPCKGIGSEYQTKWNSPDDQIIRMSGLRLPVNVLASEARYPTWVGRLRGPLTTIRHLWSIFRIAVSFRPDFVYVDRSNVVAGAAIAYLLRIPVVLRIMGVYPSMWDTLSSKSLAARVVRWAYRAPFALVICTQDGSGGEWWLPRVLRRGVSFHMLLNGRTEPVSNLVVDPRLAALPQGRIITLFVGRFEAIKGCTEFAEAMLLLNNRGRRDLHAVMIGTGRLLESVRKRVHEAEAETMFTFIDRLQHTQIAAAYLRSDIYVSLNRLGQLSNANLEAMSLGTCMVIPQAQPKEGIDIATDHLLSTEAVVRIPWDNQIDILADTISSLAGDPNRRKKLSSHIKAFAKVRVQSWDKRIAQELDLIAKQIGRSI